MFPVLTARSYCSSLESRRICFLAHFPTKNDWFDSIVTTIDLLMLMEILISYTKTGSLLDTPDEH